MAHQLRVLSPAWPDSQSSIPRTIWWEKAGPCTPSLASTLMCIQHYIKKSVLKPRPTACRSCLSGISGCVSVPIIGRISKDLSTLILLLWMPSACEFVPRVREAPRGHKGLFWHYCEPPRRCWELNPRSLEEQPVFLSTEQASYPSTGGNRFTCTRTPS